MSLESHADQPQRLLPRTIEEMLASWMRRVIGFVVFAGVACVWLSLITWSVYDPSLSHSTSDAPRNALGIVGALMSDFVLQAVGLAAVFMLIPLMIGGLQLMLDESIRNLRSRLILLSIGVPALAASLAALPPPARWLLPYGYGGVIGNFLYELCAGIIGVIVPAGGGAAAGISLAILGSWALIGAMGLDRRQLFELVSLTGRSTSRAADFCLPSGASLLQSASRTVGLGGASSADATAHRAEPPISRVEPALSLMTQPAVHQHGDGEEDGDIYRNFEEADPHEIAINRQMAERFRPRGMGGPAAAQPKADDFREPRLPELPLSHRPAQSDALGAPEDCHDDFVTGTFPTIGGNRGRHDDPIFGANPPGMMREIGYRRPSLNLLTRPAGTRPAQANDMHLKGMAKLLEDVLADFRVKGEVTEIRPGPVVTLFEFEPARGIKSSRIIALADDIARSMSATSARVAPVPGRSVIGIELPNARRDTVALRDLLEAPAFRSSEAKLPLALGKSIAGDPVVADLSRMPHLLVAGTT
ncbi:MAG: DNA translocase FtsK 4TM domain-containing protein, partial [Hyphomicrobiaceae bacterium]|nr:DNA translocase FtsK 4TM domain-containing protein [Hyphomicrobiaceae bacterium]